MKKTIAYLLAAVLAISSAFPVYAADGLEVPGNEAVPGAISNAETDDAGKDGENLTENELSGGENDGQQKTEGEVSDGDIGEPVQSNAQAFVLSEDEEEDTDQGIAPIQASVPAENGMDAGTETKNRVRVQITSVRDLASAETFDVTLGGESKQLTLMASASDQEQDAPSKAEVTFEVEPGETYELQVTGSRYLCYTQNIPVEDKYDVLVPLVNGPMMQKSGAGEQPHPGVLLLGDVNGDQKLNGDDADLIVDEMEEHVGEESPKLENPEYDLNNDGTVDMADLQCLNNSMQSTEKDATLEKVISAKLLNAVNTEATIKEGSTIADIFSDAGKTVQLEPQKGGTISETNPVEIEIPVANGETNEVKMGGLTLEGNYDNLITGGTIEVETADQGTITVEIEAPAESDTQSALSGQVSLNKVSPMKKLSGLFAGLLVPVTVHAADSTVKARWENGVLVADFGGQVAVKKVTIKITGVQNNNLAEISQVEFLNDMESRIPEPTLDIPQNVKAEPASEQFTVTWNECVNVTGYEVEFWKKGDTSKKELRKTSDNSIDIMSFGNDELLNFTTYEVRVQSVNGAWKSGFCKEVEVTPFSNDKPPKPDNLKAVGEYRSVMLSWKKMKNTVSYNLYYKKESDETYKKIETIEKNVYELSGLEDNVTYELYITGNNKNGEGPASIPVKATTVSIMKVELPKYKLINRSKGEGKLSEHIVSASISGTDKRQMMDSPLDGDDKKSALGVFDNQFTSYYHIADWDDGAHYYGVDKGVTVTLDGEQHVGYIAFAQATERCALAGVRVTADGKTVEGVSMVRRTDSNNRVYYLIKLPAKGIQATKFQVSIWSYGSGLSIAEMRLYAYDDLEDTVLGLFEDELHTTLRADVTETDLDDLQRRLETKTDGEFHLEKDMIQKEIDYARTVLHEQDLEPAVQIHTTITAMKDGGKGFGGLNPWQPLGVAAHANENVIVYVGSNKGKLGDNTDLYLYASQYHSESGEFCKQVARLRVGRNEVTIPKITSNDVEKGGSLYVAYAGNNANDQYAVRVRGGVKIPTLDLYHVTDKQEWDARVLAYVTELSDSVSKIESVHDEAHANGDAAVNYAYDEQNCIAGATEILLDQMMYSVSAKQIWKGLNAAGSLQEKADQLSGSLAGMEQMMTLFYQHKGLNNAAEDQVDQIPAQHLNIRYHRMFAGAFMYASGDHIGIDWNEVSLLAGCSEIESANGKYVSGNWFGWGIGHEIGHDINQGCYAVAEITNNYFAQLSTRQTESNDTARFKYPEVYQYVTSNAYGRPESLSVALAMYWQLHLAYDRGYNYKTYDSYEEQLENLFYARVDTYARTPEKAPMKEEDGVALTLGNDETQNLIRLASAAAEKDLTEFFHRWGLEADAETKAYISQFEPETRAIYYANDESRVKEIEGTAGSIAGQDILQDMTAVVDTTDKNAVTIALGVKENEDAVLGYEITRCTTSGGQVEEQPVGFTTENTFTDHVTAINNRVITYKVTAVDHCLNRSASKLLAPVKVEHEGDHDKSDWKVTYENLTPSQNELEKNTEESPDEKITKDGREAVIDNDPKTVFSGTAKDGEAAVILDFRRSLTVTGFRYKKCEENGITKYKVLLSSDGTNWKEAAEGTFDPGKDNLVYFQNEDQSWICTQEASYLKLVAVEQSGEIAVAELDVLGPTGDNVDLRKTEDSSTALIGYLKEAYTYDAQQDPIPEGSLVFAGQYKGNPAYNVVLLYNENGEIVGGTDEDGALKAQQIILATVPEDGLLGETYDGTWIYWIEPKDLEEMAIPKKVRAELYRVNDAKTNEGQRLVSDSMFYELPDELPEIQFAGQQ